MPLRPGARAVQPPALACGRARHTQRPPLEWTTPPTSLSLSKHPVPACIPPPKNSYLDQKTCDLHYNGFCNSVLWQLFHYVPLNIGKPPNGFLARLQLL